MGYQKKVLVVEDEEILATNLLVQARRCQWDGVAAANGADGIALAESFRPDLVLLDYHLPDMNGFEILDAIPPAARPNHFILMTGHPTDTVMADAKRRGVLCILCKPFSLADLAWLLRSMTHQSPPPL